MLACREGYAASTVAVKAQVNKFACSVLPCIGTGARAGHAGSAVGCASVLQKGRVFKAPL